MKNMTCPSPTHDTGRQRTDKSLQKVRQDIAKLPTKDVQKLVQDLQMHQIELEMQNGDDPTSCYVIKCTGKVLEKERKQPKTFVSLLSGEGGLLFPGD